MDLGTLVDCSPGLGVQPPMTFNAFEIIANDLSSTADTVAEKAVKDSKETPSVWFVNFPDQSAAEQQTLLAEYMQNVTVYYPL